MAPVSKRGENMSSGYENAPATKMLATHCACCSRPLVDAKSVEIGVGPECRKRHGFDVDVDEEARQRANAIVYAIALEQTGPGVVEGCVELRELGFVTLADRILHRLKTIIISHDQDGMLVLKSPYDPDAVRALARIPGRRWDKDRKVNVFPINQKRALWLVLLEHYQGLMGVGPKGAFEIVAVDGTTDA
jgi:hypothetical protein